MMWILGWAALLAAAIPGGAAGESAGSISGIVEDKYGMRLPGQIVSIGAHRTVSDGDGRFSFTGTRISAPYNLVVASPEGNRATLYHGLTRRDPLVTHTALHPGVFTQRAYIAGTVFGNMPKGSLDDRPRNWSWEFDFESPRAHMGERPRAGWFDATGSGAYGPIPVEWDGSDTITGRMMALFREGKDSVERGAFAEKIVTLRAGQTLTVDFRPDRVPLMHRRSPRIVEPPPEKPEDPLDDGFPRGQAPIFYDGFKVEGRSSFHGDRYSGTTVDLRAFGFQYCHDAYRWDPYLHSKRSHCGFDPANPEALDLPPPVSFTKPENGAVAAPGMTFAWTRMPRAVYCLDLAPGWDDPSARHPSVRICTGRTAAAWPDLTGVGVGFPKQLAAYVATVSAIGSMGSVDDLAASGSYRDYWKSESKERSVRIHPPLARKTAACRYGPWAVCSANEIYLLSAPNRKLRYFPEFANAVNIHCVTDCAGARAYRRAYDKYSESHPGFDNVEPTEMDSEP